MFRLTLAALVAAALAPAGAQASVCHVHGHGAFTLPDNSARCTPGAFVKLTRRQVCTPKDRPSTPAAVRREVLGEYGVPNFTGASGEIDHRVPFFLGGLTVAANLWPERGSIPNPKDALENAVRRRVCLGDPVRMRVRTARRIFLGEWTFSYGPIALRLKPAGVP